jgi:hypothetical protein
MEQTKGSLLQTFIRTFGQPLQTMDGISFLSPIALAPIMFGEWILMEKIRFS